jgi:hypothetical protein
VKRERIRMVRGGEGVKREGEDGKRERERMRMFREEAIGRDGGIVRERNG